jgi:hypothetical protein
MSQKVILHNTGHILHKRQPSHSTYHQPNLLEFYLLFLNLFLFWKQDFLNFISSKVIYYLFYSVFTLESLAFETYEHK